MRTRQRQTRLALALLVTLIAAGEMAIAGSTGGDPFVRAVPIASAAGPLAVDTRTERLFLVNAPDNAVDVFDAISGRQLRTVVVGDNPSGVAVDSGANRVFVADNSSDGHGLAGSVSVLDGATGRLVRRYLLPGGVVPHALCLDTRDHRLYAATLSGRVEVLDEDSGRVLATVTLSRRDTFTVHLAVAEPGGPLFVTNDDVGPISPPSHGLVGVLDARSGRLRRTAVVGALPQAIAVDTAAQRAIVVSQQPWPRGSVAILGGRSGRPLRTIITPAPPVGLAVDAQTGRAFIPYQADTVGVLDTRRARFAGSVALAPPAGAASYPVGLALDERAGRVYVMTTAEVFHSVADQQRTVAVSVLDAGSGAILRTITVGPPVQLGPGTALIDEQAPHLMAVDGRSGHVFLIVEGGPTRVPGAWSWIPAWLRRGLPFLPRLTFSTHRVPTRLVTLDPTR